MTAAKRPSATPRVVYLNLLRIRLPLPGIVSILHRISGAGLFLAGIPLLLAAAATSFASPEGYARVAHVLANPLVKLALIGFAWAYLHHFFCGIRFLLLDLHWGVELKSARRTSVAVIVLSLALTLLFAVWLW